MKCIKVISMLVGKTQYSEKGKQHQPAVKN